MPLKKWVLNKVHGPGQTLEPDRRRAPSLRSASPDADDRYDEHPRTGADNQGGHGDAAHLGPYAPLVAAIRGELEHFVESQLRLHLAIAERDRYVLTAIDVACEADEHDALLRRFIAEFKPEQIKRYLARDVIAGLSNAGAIDLSQFSGLNPPRDSMSEEPEDPYKDLISDLKQGGGEATSRGFDVTLAGRWVQAEAPTDEGLSKRGRRTAAEGDARQTPLAGRGLRIEIEDAKGSRSVELSSIVPGRRYVIGKDDDCEIAVDGVYASRRHCEVWFDRDAWWVVDAGSTNGIRVEAKDAVTHDSRGRDPAEPIKVPSGAAVILSAFARGDARLYPRLTLQSTASPRLRASDEASESTPATPLAPPRRSKSLTISAQMKSGIREIDLRDHALPFSIGRSRDQSLTVDSAHSDVSGRHVEVVAIDDAGVWAVVHGDNGVSIEGILHRAGEKFLWKRGQTMHLGMPGAGGACVLSLSPSE